ncbi:FRG domain-containing protein [Thalassospira lucentensis]|uniref:FRG domain-containing protein n=1 Tax=Thalassospira lucentensis TaxID=168935 RepID=UPI003AA7B548
MDCFDSELFGEVFMPNSFEEIVSSLQKKPSLANGVVRMWRGQASISWPLHSGAYRRLLQDDKTPTEKSMVFYEKRLLTRATHRGLRKYEGVELSDFELLARLQHHGAATRLLDASRNALVALYFACREHPEEVGALFGIHSNYLGGYEQEPLTTTYDVEMAAISNFSHPQTWQPSSVSPRIAAQHSQFLFSAVSKHKMGSLYIEDAEDALLTIAISPSLKSEILGILRDIFDIRFLSLFPDLDGFCEANSQSQIEVTNRW